MFTTSPSAIEVFLQRSAEVEEAFTHLYNIINAYTKIHPNDIDWSHVDELEHIIESLNNLSGFSQDKH